MYLWGGLSKAQEEPFSPDSGSESWGCVCVWCSFAAVMVSWGLSRSRDFFTRDLPTPETARRVEHAGRVHHAVAFRVVVGVKGAKGGQHM